MAESQARPFFMLRKKTDFDSTVFGVNANTSFNNLKKHSGKAHPYMRKNFLELNPELKELAHKIAMR